MILKVNFKFLSAILAVLFIYSCNGNDTVNEFQSDSADAQIYSFSLTATPITSADTANYKVLATTKFLIDAKGSIYNPDSLPFGTTIRKYAVSLSYSNAGIQNVDLIYPDTTITWNGTDSIDFAKNSIEFEITPANGAADNKKRYTIELRVHQIDPDTLIWTDKTPESWVVSNYTKQEKVVEKGSSYYYFASTSSNPVVREFDPLNAIWVSNNSTSENIIVESVTVLNNTFFAINAAGNTFSSTDGKTWNNYGNKNAHSVLGVLPGKTTADDKILLLVKDGTKYGLASTTDMQTITPIANIAGSSSNEVVANFPSSGFASTTNYNRTLADKNLLILTGGKNLSGNLSNLTWLIKNGNNGLEIGSNNFHQIFDPIANIETFAYDAKIYSIVKKDFYISPSFGINWVAVPDKQPLPKTLVETSQRSTIIDSKNVIWLFETETSGNVKVWKGRLNRLIPRK